jgi:ABC-2 type transport system ATP-binding protein
MHRTRTTAVVVLTAAVLALGACSSDSSTAKDDGTPSTSTSARPAYARPACNRSRPAPPTVTPVAGVDHDFTMTSFDGAQIRLHWYPLATEAPTVLMGPGWGEAGATENSGTGLFGDSPIGELHDQGYHVLTWDPRGFGKSTGTITIDAAANEGRDVQRILDWVATQPNVQLDGTIDPRVGMVGGSYGGGIQLQTASIDCRVDAIVPTIAWHSLGTSLFKADTVKQGWSSFLYTAAAARQLDPHIRSAYQSGIATGTISDEDRVWFRARGPGAAVARITAPTLFVQGTVDTLFTLDEAVTNYGILRDHGVPTAMLWYCGGHGACLTESGDPEATADATAAWLQRWLRDDTSVDTGPRIDVIDQDGARWTGSDWPLPAGPPISAGGAGTLALSADGGAGPAKPRAGSDNPVDGIAASITPARATNAVDVPITAGAAAFAVGAPRLTFTYSGTVPPGERPMRVFAQLVDDQNEVVVGNQITPIAVRLDGKRRTVSVPLEMIGQQLAKGDTLTLQLVATTVAYAQPRLGGTVEFTKIRVEVPTVRGLTKR